MFFGFLRLPCYLSKPNVFLAGIRGRYFGREFSRRGAAPCWQGSTSSEMMVAGVGQKSTALIQVVWAMGMSHRAIRYQGSATHKLWECVKLGEPLNDGLRRLSFCFPFNPPPKKKKKLKRFVHSREQARGGHAIDQNIASLSP